MTKQFIKTYWKHEVETLQEGDKILVQGDYYHNKVSNVIDGFLYGLEYAGIEYEVEEVYKEETEYEYC